MFNLILQLHGGGSGGSSSGSSKWIPNKYQAPVLEAMVGDGVNGPFNQFLNQSQSLLGSAGNMYGGLATQRLDYNGMLQQANGISNGAISGLQGLSTGNVNGFIGNEANALQSVLQNTMGNSLNDWAKSGVINSSVATSGMNSMAKNAASTAAQDYNNAFNNASSNFNNLLGASGQNLANAGNAQNAAQVGASNVLTDALSAYNAGAGILGTGGNTTTASSNKTGANGWLQSIAGIGMGIAACFTEGTIIKTPNGEKTIEEIRVGDKVIGYKDGEMVTNTVIEVQEPTDSEIIEVVCQSEDGKRHFVETTASQPFMNENGLWDCVNGLSVGKKLKNVGKVIAVMIVGKDKVYDLKTDGNNTYIANGYIAYGRLE